jgi:hypothetical protein
MKIREEKRKAKSAALIKPADQVVGCGSLSRPQSLKNPHHINQQNPTIAIIAMR